jgi:hypothetical protein
MLEQIVEQQTEEAADLDFKQILPIGKGEWREETAKDFAAMANSGGGVVLYGVAEKRGHGTAKSIEHIEVKEADVRSLTQVAYNLVNPPLMDVRPVTVTDPQHPERGVLAMVVLPSADVPHMYWKKDAFLAPVRHGSDTRWMDERQIEQAYLARFDGRRRRQADLAEFYNETLAHTTPSRKACLVAVATPTGIGGMDGHPAHADGAMDVFYSALRGASEFIRSDSSIFTNFYLSPSIGLRRWRWRAKEADCSHLLEFHRDGSVALVVDIDGEFIDAGSEASRAAASEWKPKTTSLAVEFALAGLAAFLSAVAQRLRNDGGYEVRTGISWEAGSADGLPLEMYLSYDRRQHASQPELIRRFTPVEGLLRAGRVDELRADLRLLCTDVLNQTGVDGISLLNTPSPGANNRHQRNA